MIGGVAAGLDDAAHHERRDAVRVVHAAALRDLHRVEDAQVHVARVGRVVADHAVVPEHGADAGWRRGSRRARSRCVPRSPTGTHGQQVGPRRHRRQRQRQQADPEARAAACAPDAVPSVNLPRRLMSGPLGARVQGEAHLDAPRPVEARRVRQLRPGRPPGSASSRRSRCCRTRSR